MNKHSVVFSVLVALSIFGSSQAFADDCNNIGSNAEWLEGMSKIQSDFKAGNYESVIETAKPMYQICATSPSLLFYTGLAIEKQGDVERATIYYQKASEALTQMPAEAGISRQIWYKRYESEHPDRTEDAVAAQKAKLDEIELKNIDLERKVADFDNQQMINASNISLDTSKKYETILWTGVGIGIAGLALAGAGAGVAQSVDGSGLIKVKDDNGLKVSTKFIAGWALIGSGIGMTVAGAIMAGIGGYNYSKSKSDAVMSFGVTPVGTSFSMTF